VFPGEVAVSPPLNLQMETERCSPAPLLLPRTPCRIERTEVSSCTLQRGWKGLAGSGISISNWEIDGVKEQTVGRREQPPQ